MTDIAADFKLWWILDSKLSDAELYDTGKILAELDETYPGVDLNDLDPDDVMAIAGKYER